MSSFHMLGIAPDIIDYKFEDDPTLSLWTNKKSPTNTVRTQRRAQGRKSKFGWDIHTPGHIKYLHTKFYHSTTSNKKSPKNGVRGKNDHGPWY